MKKFLIIFLSAIIVGGLIRYNCISSKCKNVNYVVQKYFTTGILNNYKMCSVSTVNLSFSNGTVAVVKVEGIEDKSPHKKTAYNVFLEKNGQDIWKIKKIYAAEANSKSQQ
jgi:hypothetical protein